MDYRRFYDAVFNASVFLHNEYLITLYDTAFVRSKDDEG